MQRNDSKKVSTEVCVVGCGITGLATIALLYHNQAVGGFPLKNITIHAIEKRDINNYTRRQKLIIQADRDLTWDMLFCLLVLDVAKALIPSATIEKLTTQVNNQTLTVEDKEDEENNLIIEHFNELMNDLDNPTLDQKTFAKFIQKLKNQTAGQILIEKHDKPFVNFSIKEVQKALLAYINIMKQHFPNIKLIWHSQTVVSDVDINNQLVILKSPDKPLKFDTLLICDGSNRETLEVMKQALSNTNVAPFVFELFDHQPIQYNCAVRLYIDKTALTENNFQNFHEMFECLKSKDILSNRVDAAKRIASLGWDMQQYPRVNFIIDDNFYKFKENYNHFPDNTIPRMFVASGIPEAIFNIKDPEEKRKQIIEWAKLIVQLHLGIPAGNLAFDTKGEDENHKLNAVTFIAQIKHVDHVVRKLPNGGFIIVAGDSAMSPYYEQGNSSTFALNAANETSLGVLNDSNFEIVESRYKSDCALMAKTLKDHRQPKQGHYKISQHNMFQAKESPTQSAEETESTKSSAKPHGKSETDA